MMRLCLFVVGATALLPPVAIHPRAAKALPRRCQQNGVTRVRRRVRRAYQKRTRNRSRNTTRSAKLRTPQSTPPLSTGRSSSRTSADGASAGTSSSGEKRGTEPTRCVQLQRRRWQAEEIIFPTRRGTKRQPWGLGRRQPDDLRVSAEPRVLAPDAVRRCASCTIGRLPRQRATDQRKGKGKRPARGSPARAVGTWRHRT